MRVFSMLQASLVMYREVCMFPGVSRRLSEMRCRLCVPGNHHFGKQSGLGGFPFPAEHVHKAGSPVHDGDPGHHGPTSAEMELPGEPRWPAWQHAKRQPCNQATCNLGDHSNQHPRSRLDIYETQDSFNNYLEALANKDCCVRGHTA